MAKPTPVFYVFHGTDEFSMAERLDDLRRRLGPPETADLNTTVLDGRTVTLSELRHACDSAPFLEDRRLVIVNNLLARLTPRKDEELPQGLKEFLAALADYLPRLPETTRLVFAEEKALSDKHPIVKMAREDERGYLRQFSPPDKDDLPRWVQERARKHGAKIGDRAAEQLATSIGPELRLLDQEIQKLVTYAGPGRAITVADVDAVVPYVQVAVVFDLVDALGHRDGTTAARVLQRLLETEHPLVILAMIVRQYRLLIELKDLESRGATWQNVGDTLKLRPFVARKLHTQALRFTAVQLEAAYRYLLDTDVAIKTGRLDAEVALELLIADLAAVEA